MSEAEVAFNGKLNRSKATANRQLFPFNLPPKWPTLCRVGR